VLGIEVDVRDHEAVEAMVARVVQEWGGSMCLSPMSAAAVVGPWIPRPAPSIRLYIQRSFGTPLARVCARRNLPR
jgi:hypothetical protein